LTRGDDPELEVAAAFHRDPEVLQLARERLAAYPARTDQGLGADVARTLEPQVLAHVPPEQMRALLPPEYAPYVERFGVHSLVAAPLRMRERLTGILVAWRDVTKRPFHSDDAHLLDELASRAALA